jgi:hypothetical protein
MVDMVGKTVIKVQCDGCMAEDHKIKAVGKVTSIMKANRIWPGTTDRYDYAACLVMNSHLDAGKSWFYVALQDTSLQVSRYDPMTYFHYV